MLAGSRPSSLQGFRPSRSSEGGHARPTEEPSPELLLFKASGLQGRAREAMRGPQRIRTLNAEGLQAFISSRLPAFKGERGRPLTPTEDRDAECWRAPGLHLFKASSLQGRPARSSEGGHARPTEEPNAELLLFTASGLQGPVREATRGPQRSRTRQCWRLGRPHETSHARP